VAGGSLRDVIFRDHIEDLSVGFIEPSKVNSRVDCVVKRTSLRQDNDEIMEDDILIGEYKNYSRNLQTDELTNILDKFKSRKESKICIVLRKSVMENSPIDDAEKIN
jgi:hypothetical protein